MTDETDRELENLSDEEREALEGEDIGSLRDAEVAARAAEAADADPPEDPPAPANSADAAEAAAAASMDAGTPAEADDVAADEFSMRLAPPALDGHQEELASLLDTRKAIRESYRNGDISAEEKDQKEDEVNDQISDLRTAVANAAFVDNFNQQAAEKDYLATVARVRADIRDKDGIDYDNNGMLERNWDLKVKALAADPANAQKSGDWFLREAHKMVKAELEQAASALGFTKAEQRKADPVGDAVRGRRPAETRAKSLAALPAAAADTGGGDTEFAHLERLDGEDYETAVARMTPDQQERWARQ